MGHTQTEEEILQQIAELLEGDRSNMSITARTNMEVLLSDVFVGLQALATTTDNSTQRLDQLEQDMLEVQKEGDIKAPIPAVLAHLTSDQSIPNTTPTAVNWDAIQYDQFDIWDGTTGFVIPSWADYAKVTAKIEFASNTTGSDRSSWLHLNGSELIGMGYSNIAPHGGRNVVNYTSGIFSVADGDTITNIVNQDSGGALNLLTGTANQRCFIQIELYESNV